MLRKPLLVRAIALFLLVNFLNSLFFPSVALALTAGPTAPEATSFEPVDTTDMVNLISGDFNYNIPLVEVPGPEGGYPLSLSYHAGIQPNEDASWTGLGWSLNPGAITRTVNGYPDDYNNVQEVDRAYWIGGKRETFAAAISFAIPGVKTAVSKARSPANLSFGLEYSQDTYQGVGIGVSMGLSNMKMAKSPTGPKAGLSVGVEPYGGAYMAGSVSSTKQIQGTALGLTQNLSVRTNFQSISASANGTISGPLGLGATIASGASNASFSAGGYTASAHNDQAGRISTSSSGWSVSGPTGIPGLNLSLSHNVTRYWSDETSTTSTSGALYSPKTALSPAQLDEQSFDTYGLLDPTQNIIDAPDPNYVAGGNFPDCDVYSVTAQGLSGNIRPYLLQRTLYQRNRKAVNYFNSNTYEYKSYYYNLPHKGGKVGFRFENDFSNKFLQQPASLTINGNELTSNFGGVASGVYNEQESQLPGSKHIEWFTNYDVYLNINKEGTAYNSGFIDCKAQGFSRYVRIRNQYNTAFSKEAEQVGGFMITNASGVTYHYALPAYSSEEEMRSENNGDLTNYNLLKRKVPYAYTWYLTAITGPDYVDTNTNGLLDGGDWGYWVAFDYGLWTSAYNWRNPSEGYRLDVDQNFRNYSAGTKELYYLNAIRTRTHTALFEKDVRNDGRGVAKKDGAGGFQADAGANPATPVLKLAKVYLLNNKDVPVSLETKSTEYDASYPTAFAKNVIDTKDIDQVRTQLVNSSLRIIDQQHDYSLCPDVSNNSQAVSGYHTTTTTGKLTLKEVKFLGKQGANLLPSTKFDYELPAQERKAGSVTVSTVFDLSQKLSKGYLNTTDLTTFKEGDLISFSLSGPSGSQTFYCAILKKVTQSNGQLSYWVNYLKERPDASFANLTAKAINTKNPPYNKDFYDMWNLYKSDYQDTGNENASRIPSNASADAYDVWSLRRIQSPLGASIKVAYESDDYTRPLLYKSSMLSIKSLTPSVTNTSEVEVVFNEDVDLTTLFNPTTEVKLQFVLGNIFIPRTNAVCTGCHIISGIYSGNIYDMYTYGSGSADPLNTLTFSKIETNKLILNSARLRTLLTSKKTSIPNPTPEKCSDITGSNRNFMMDFPDLPRLVVGNVYLNDSFHTKGGGLRVRSVAVEDGNGFESSIQYEYNNSGVTSYEPVGMDKAIFNFYGWDTWDHECADFENKRVEAIRKVYQKDLYSLFGPLLANAREVPPPGVMYKYVTVKSGVKHPDGKVQAIPGKTTYEFVVFNDSMVKIDKTLYQDATVNYTNMPSGLGISKIMAQTIRKKDYTSQIGSLKRVISYDDLGNKLTETVTNFLYEQQDGESVHASQFNSQGIIQEAFVTARFAVSYLPGGDNLLGVSSTQEEYPSIITGTWTKNYKTGVEATTTNLGFDFYSGELTKSVEKDAYGNQFYTENIPAYQLVDASLANPYYPQLGLKVGSSSKTLANKHMLTQPGTSKMWELNPGVNGKDLPVENIPNSFFKGLVSATAQTWSNQNVLINGAVTSQSNVWRPQSSYSWLPLNASASNGLTDPLNFKEFFKGGSGNPAWQKISEITLYDQFSKPLEAKDFNGGYAATKIGDNYTKTFASAALANYSEIAYSGAEEAILNNGFSGGVSIGSGSTLATASVTAHTGTRSLNVPGGMQGFIYSSIYQTESATKRPMLKSNRPYRASVWVKGSDVSGARLYYKVGGGAATFSSAPIVAKSTNGWYLITLDIPAQASAVDGTTSLEVGCQSIGSVGLYFDDFRFQPLQSSLTAYVYDAFSGELTHILDNNNLFTRFEYDAVGRLTKTYRETFGYGVKQVSENSYYYARKAN